MDITSIILTSLTLIAVGVGLFLNHKTNQNLVQKLKSFEEKTNQNTAVTRDAILDNIKEHKVENSKQLDNSTSEIKKTIVDRYEHLNTAVAESIETICKTINNNIHSLKTDLIETFENKSSKTIEDIQNSNAKLQKETADTIEARLKVFQLEIQSTLEKIKIEFETSSISINKSALKTETEIKNKIDSALKIQDEQQIQALAIMDEKFQKVINEIKSPLDLD